MSAYKANPLLDAATVLVGWTNRSATRDTEKLFASGEVVRLNTKLDATLHFTLMVSHPGHSVAVETQLELAPVLRDGTMGTFVGVATVAIPAEGGRVEAYISGKDIQLDAADQGNVDSAALCFARAIVSPSTPEGMVVGLTIRLARPLRLRLMAAAALLRVAGWLMGAETVVEVRQSPR